MPYRQSPRLENPNARSHDSTIEAAISQLGPWFHNLHLPGGQQTAPHHFLGDFPSCKWRAIGPFLPEDMDGWNVLDIGCNAGFYSFALAERGARVIGIDSDLHYLRQAEWLANHFYSENRPRFLQMQVHDVAHWEMKFDLVLFMGVFYHLRYPTLALDTIASKVKRLMIFQTMTMDSEAVVTPREDYPIDERHIFELRGWPKMAFIEKKFSNDSTNWWVPNHAAVEALLRSTGFAKTKRIAHEIYLCHAPPNGVNSTRKWDEDEWASATRKES